MIEALSERNGDEGRRDKEEGKIKMSPSWEE